MHDKVDALIIGSGAPGATVAWSLADTNMRIVCLEQGDWVRPNHDPSNRRDQESHRYGDFATIPIRRDLPADYPINDDGSPIKIVNVNGVGGSTVMCMGHFPRLHPSDFKVRALDGVANDWPIDYDTLEPFLPVIFISARPEAATQKRAATRRNQGLFESLSMVQPCWRRSTTPPWRHHKASNHGG